MQISRSIFFIFLYPREMVSLVSLTNFKLFEPNGCEVTDQSSLGGGGGGEAKTKKSVVLQQIFIQKVLSQKPKALFKTYSKINVWWLLLSE